MTVTITRDGKRYRLTTAEMLEVSRCLRINFMKDELVNVFGVPFRKSEALAIEADKLYTSGETDRTEYECIVEVAQKHGYERY